MVGFSGVSRVTGLVLVLGLALGLGLVSLVPVYVLPWRTLNFSRPVLRHINLWWPESVYDEVVLL